MRKIRIRIRVWPSSSAPFAKLLCAVIVVTSTSVSCAGKHSVVCAEMVVLLIASVERLSAVKSVNRRKNAIFVRNENVWNATIWKAI